MRNTQSHTNRNKGTNPLTGNVIWDSATPRKVHSAGGNGLGVAKVRYVGQGAYSQRAARRDNAEAVYRQQVRQAARRERFEADGY